MNRGESWIKLYRSLLDWEWYTDGPTKDVFLHLLLLANTKEQTRKGIVIPAGSVEITQAQIANHLKLTRQQVRTALFHLQKTGEVTIQRHREFSVYTIVRWHSLQGKQPSKTQRTRNQSTINQPLGNHLYKKNKEGKNIEENREPSREEIQSRFLRSKQELEDEEEGWT